MLVKTIFFVTFERAQLTGVFMPYLSFQIIFLLVKPGLPEWSTFQLLDTNRKHKARLEKSASTKCTKRLLVITRSSLLVMIIYKCTKYYNSLIA